LLISNVEAVQLLGTMMGGYNVGSLVELMQVSDVAIATALSKTLLVYDAFHDVQELACSLCSNAKPNKSRALGYLCIHIFVDMTFSLRHKPLTVR
jgi:aconitase B